MGHLVPGFSNDSRTEQVHGACQGAHKTLARTKLSRIRLNLNRMAVDVLHLATPLLLRTGVVPNEPQSDPHL